VPHPLVRSLDATLPGRQIWHLLVALKLSYKELGEAGTETQERQADGLELQIMKIRIKGTCSNKQIDLFRVEI
jgi:hypothetical protein